MRKRSRQAASGRALARPRGRQRGVALIIVVSSLAILAAVAVDFQYNSTIDLQLAANARDELRAEYLARSAINLSRLLLRFQRQLDSQTSLNWGQLLGSLMGATGMTPAPAATPPAAGATPGSGGGLNIRLWEIVPIDSSLFGMLLADGGGGPPASDAPAFGEEDDLPLKALAHKGAAAKAQSFGDFSGAFRAEIQDEEQKINVNRLNFGAIQGQAPMHQALLLIGDPRFDFVFDKADANGVKLTAQETLIALHDWIDENDTQAVLNITGTGDPFPDGFGDENRNYSRYPFRYRAKNSDFDSLDELSQVDGVSDLFMAAFRDRLTVYPDKNKLLNINTNDPIQQYVNIATVAASELDPKLRNPLIVQAILQEIAWWKMFSFMGMSAATFVGIVERNGIAVRPELKTNIATNKYIGDKSETFTIKATGQAGRVERTVTAVVRHNEGLGKLLYFHLD